MCIERFQGPCNPVSANKRWNLTLASTNLKRLNSRLMTQAVRDFRPDPTTKVCKQGIIITRRGKKRPKKGKTHYLWRHGLFSEIVRNFARLRPPTGTFEG